MTIKKIIFIFFMFCCSSSCFANDIATENAGEKAMIGCLREAINRHPDLDTNQHKIIIGAGVSGCKAFQSSAKQNELHVLLTWQWLDALQNISTDTIVVVPKHAIDKRFKALEAKGVRLIPISGVLHTKTINSIKAESISHIDPLVTYIVMLAGDTQQEDGSWVRYDRTMLSDLLNSLPKDKHILILNGPRTGKHLENTSTLDEAAHKTSLDYITHAVKSENVEKWEIVDFQYGKKSLWDSALAFCMKNPKVGLILPGESTSMISEALSLGILPIIYEHAAMTPASRNYVEQLKENKQILIYPAWDQQIYKQTPVENQTDKILESLQVLIKAR